MGRTDGWRAAKTALVVAGWLGAGIGSAAAQTAMPHGGQVVQGQATISTPSASQMVIAQGSQRAIINWKGFSIGPGGRLVIKQPNAQAAILNRVTGGDLSRISGQLQANGQVYLLNPHGIVIGPGGRVDTAAFLASVLHVSNRAFMAGGPMLFSGHSTAGILNLGTIHAATGDVALFGPAVANHGTIEASQGTAALVSGGEILFAPDSAESFYIKAPVVGSDGQTPVDNSGVIKAAQVELKAAGSAYALAVNNSGLIAATAMKKVGGRIVLEAGDGDASVSGTMTARAGDNGGTIDIHGGQVEVTSGTTIQADAIGRGHGGSVTVLADGATRFSGLIRARGGAEGGDGGNAEVSGHTLWFAGRADLSAPHGRTGTLLLDPVDLTIDAAAASAIAGGLDTANVTESATNSVTVSAPITNSTTTNTLTLDAPAVNVNADITIPNGELDFGTTAVAGTSVASSSSATLNVGTLTVYGNYQTVSLAGPVTAGAFGYAPTSSTLASLTVNNASNAIDSFNLTNGTVTLTGNADLRTTTATTVGNKLTVGGDLTIVAGGDLTFGGGGPELTVAGTTKLASTGGAFINAAGAGLLAGAGRKIIWSSTDSGGFNDGGLGYTQYNPVSYPNDPRGAGNIIYIKTASGLPVLTITADDKSVEYGAADPTFSASYAGGSTSDLTGAVLFQVSGAHANVGSYTITPFGAASSTHILNYIGGTLTVTPALLTITANDFTRTYGSANPIFSATASPLFNGDTLGAVVPDLSFSTPATKRSDVGTYAITPSGTPASGNYTLQFVPGTLTVDKATLIATVNDASRLYGASNPSFSASFSGLLNGDSPSVVSGLTFTTKASAKAPVGTYPINLFGGIAKNYVVVQAGSGTLTVTPAPVQVTTIPESVVYGQSAPAPQVSADGLFFGDTPASIGLLASADVLPGDGVGTYSTSLSSRGGDPNYAIQFTPGTVTVTPAPLTITADDATSYLSFPLPDLTATVTGLFGNDTVNNIQLTTPAKSNSPIADYPIVPSSDPMSNYDITYVNGTLKVISPFTSTQSVIRTKDTQIVQTDLVRKDVLRLKINETTAYALFNNAPSVVDEAVRLMDATGLNGADTDENVAADIRIMHIVLSQGKLDLASFGGGTLAKLLPFLVQEAKNILDRDPTTWSADESNFIEFMTQVVSDQKKQAAQQAYDQYTQWKNDRQAVADKSGLISTIYIQQVPPDTFLKEAKTGLSLDSSNAQTYMGLVVQAAGLAAGAGAGKAATALAGADAVKAIMPNIEKTAQQFVKQAIAQAVDKAGVRAGTAAAKQVAAEVTEELGDVVAGAVEAGAEVVGAAVGVAIEAIVTIVQTSIQVANVNDYEKQMNQAVADAGKPVTTADLKSMLSSGDGATQAFTYLAAHFANTMPKPTKESK